MWTSDGRFCLGGITRGNVLEVCRDAGITARETTFSLTDVYSAQEAFVTGTFAGLVPVRTVDGRTIGTGRPRTGRRAAAGAVRRARRRRRRRAGARAVTCRLAMWSGPAQHLDRDDAGLGEPARHRRGRRAALRGVPAPHRPRPPRPRRGDRLPADRPRQVVGDLRAPLPTAHASTTPST